MGLGKLTPSVMMSLILSLTGNVYIHPTATIDPTAV
ncbi:hypothetical protein scyTo_0026736, partial [Scyliorhinus torazame]|nr:hypothetical protein [Scyliorhinus torazame]